MPAAYGVNGSDNGQAAAAGTGAQAPGRADDAAAPPSAQQESERTSWESWLRFFEQMDQASEQQEKLRSELQVRHLAAFSLRQLARPPHAHSQPGPARAPQHAQGRSADAHGCGAPLAF